MHEHALDAGGWAPGVRQTRLCLRKFKPKGARLQVVDHTFLAPASPWDSPYCCCCRDEMALDDVLAEDALCERVARVSIVQDA